MYGCRHFGLNRSTYAYRAKEADAWEAKLKGALRRKSNEHPECLNREELWTLTEVRVVIEDWRWKYNHVRPHRSLGYITPNEYATG